MLLIELQYELQAESDWLPRGIHAVDAKQVGMMNLLSFRLDRPITSLRHGAESTEWMWDYVYCMNYMCAVLIL